MLIWKLLRQNISIPQFLGYSIASLIGISIVLLSLSFYLDVAPIFSSDKGVFKTDFIVLSKKVSLLSNLRTNKLAFNKKEIEDIEKQPFVKKLSFITTCNYKVEAYIEMTSGQSFSTQLFFESVPDYLLDVTSKDWFWNDESRLIPVVLPRNYLNLYNFGFAQSQGLPQISENLIENFTINVLITGENGRREVFKSRIVGFSNRINTILVPEKFMEWANQNFSNKNEVNISRVILEVTNPANPLIAEYIKKKNFEINDDKEEQSVLSYYLKMLIIGVASIGVLIMILAIGLMLLTINLLIYKNQKTFENLFLQGYIHYQLVKPYFIVTFFINICVCFFAFIVTFLIRNLYSSYLNVIISIEGNFSTFKIILSGFVFIIIIITLNCIWINYKVKLIKLPQRR